MTRSKERSVDLLEHEVGVLVRRIKRVMGDRARATHPDLSAPVYFLLSFLAENGPSRPGELAERFGIDKGAISRHVNHLCELGLIERTPDPIDGRAHHVTVSEEGRRRLVAGARERRQLLDRRLSGWSAEELSDFVDLLARYNASLDATGEVSQEAAVGTPARSASSG